MTGREKFVMDEEQPASGADAVPPALPPDATRGGLAWLHEGARVLALRMPRWQGLKARPLTVAVLVLAGYLLALTVQRALVAGEPQFLWNGILGGWVGIAVMAWLCWVVARSGERTGNRTGAAAVSPATLLAVSCGAGLVLNLCSSAVLLVLAAVLGPGEDWPAALAWTVWLAPMVWAWLAQVVLLCRVAGPSPARAAVLVFTVIPLVVGGWLAPVTFWWSEPPADNEPRYTGLPLTDEVVSAQPQLLDDALDELQPPRSERVNVYAITFAPYASEDVFMRESAVVARTMRERFGADGRLVELVMNPATVTTLPWATPVNLRKTIAHLATVMDRDRDVLFLHLTSHGGADGKLASNTWPLQTEPMTPELLKRWLNEAGVRWRVISVSACYSGSWIAPLAGDGTLVMTAADADHTSYGCGKRSELTFFGRAMYEEELRKTWSFTEAHAAARKLIEAREQAAGKSDGYSNPQISEGAGVSGVLQRLAQQQRGL
jgi:Peptidase C13 family